MSYLSGFTVHQHTHIVAHTHLPIVLVSRGRELHGGDETLVSSQHGNGGGALRAPHPHRFVQAARGYHLVIEAEGDVGHLCRVAPERGQQLATPTRPHLQEVVICSLGR